MVKNHQTALVTGASSGIGNELARLLAQDGYNLVIVGRNESALKTLAEELEEKYKIFVKVIVKDLINPGSPEEIFNETQKDDLKISILVNNAGIGTFGEFIQTGLQEELNLLQINIVSLTHLTKLYSKEMVKTGKGRILNVASTAAFQPGPLMAVYYASKSYVLSFSEALANELKEKGIVVTALCPGPTKTNFQKNADMEDSRLLKVLSMMSASEVAKAGYEGLKNGKSIVIPGLQNKFLAFGIRFFPRKLVTMSTKIVQKKLK